MSRVDARLREMQFLARLDREGTIKLDSAAPGMRSRDQEEVRMIASLIHDGYVNGIEDVIVGYGEAYKLLDNYRYRVASYISELLNGQGAALRISHKGRVRLSELEQQLRTGRDRDETGLLWAKRHLEIDLAIALLSAGDDAPLTVVFLDMNGLKAINDSRGHAAGDEAIRAFFQSVMSTLGQCGEAYRNGGDEVVVVLPKTTDERAGKLLDGFVRQLGKEVLRLGNSTAELALTASCGSVATANPAEDAKALLERADQVQYRAKQKSKEHTPRVSAMAVGDREVTTYAPSGS